MFGRRYVIEHCISAFRLSQAEKTYRIYLTDALRAIVGGQNPRYFDLINPKTDNRDAEEIKAQILTKLREL